MAQLTCEICGGTNFVKDEGLFVCQGCGLKYTLQEAQRLMGQAPAATAAPAPAPTQPQAAPAQDKTDQPSPVASALSAVASFAGALITAMADGASATQETVTDFDHASAKDANNYACRAWQALLSEYRGIDHPSLEDQKLLVARAQECLTLLDDASMLEPDNHVLDLLIFENCRELVRSAKDTYHYEQDEEGAWKRKSLPSNVKVEVPGQKGSYEKRAETHRKVIEQEYLDAHAPEVLQRERLVAEAERIGAELDTLKAEKRSQGLFNFSGKREVKDRMKPVEEELRGVKRQIAELDGKVDDYVDARLVELAKTHIRLDF